MYIYIYIIFFLYVWLSFQGVKHYTYLGAMKGDLVGRWQWGGGDGLHAESDWRVWHSAPLEVV